jgi:hypothetical protein
MPKNDYCDRTLIRLKRQYSKDEVVAALSKKLSERDFEIGQLKSEIYHLKSVLNADNEQKLINRKGKIEARKDELFNLKSEENKKLKKQIKQLRQQKDELFSKLLKYDLRNKSIIRPDSRASEIH